MPDQPIVIDTKMYGVPGLTGAFIVAGEHTALVETGPKSSVEHLLGGLEAAGVESVDWIVVTHIHLDHAGAAGTLARRWPAARIGVHTVGAPHLIDPAKLWSSAARIYGDDMERLWGGIDPIDEDRITPLEDGDTIDLGGRTLTAVDTPGHAYHHHALVDDATGILFSGDALGVRLPDAGFFRPATPPPEFHLEKAMASIERIRSLSPSELWLTHFGASNVGTSPVGVEEACDEAIAALKRWEQWVLEGRREGGDLDDVARVVGKRWREEAVATLEPDDVARMEQTTSTWMNTWGYMRYLDKQEQGE